MNRIVLGNEKFGSGLTIDLMAMIEGSDLTPHTRVIHARIYEVTLGEILQISAPDATRMPCRPFTGRRARWMDQSGGFEQRDGQRKEKTLGPDDTMPSGSEVKSACWGKCCQWINQYSLPDRRLRYR